MYADDLQVRDVVAQHADVLRLHADWTQATQCAVMACTSVPACMHDYGHQYVRGIEMNGNARARPGRPSW